MPNSVFFSFLFFFSEEVHAFHHVMHFVTESLAVHWQCVQFHNGAGLCHLHVAVPWAGGIC